MFVRLTPGVTGGYGASAQNCCRGTRLNTRPRGFRTASAGEGGFTVTVHFFH